MLLEIFEEAYLYASKGISSRVTVLYREREKNNPAKHFEQTVKDSKPETELLFIGVIPS